MLGPLLEARAREAPRRLPACFAIFDFNVGSTPASWQAA
jgi:hypothetical protein